MDFAALDTRQQEMLVDFALTEGVQHLHTELVTAVLASDWQRITRDHL
ncbi:MAG TPA: hypothetical protein VG713_05845 [Pirellulales bacterium]|nr:hypothetical protein [Pirellulales bacterium]